MFDLRLNGSETLLNKATDGERIVPMESGYATRLETDWELFNKTSRAPETL